MADIDLKTETPDTTLPTDGFLFGADSQSAASPSVYPVQSLATTLLGSTTLSGATVTTDAPVLNLSQTWNDAAVTFTGLKFNATDTASASGSLLLDLQAGGTSRVSIRKNGNITVSSAAIPDSSVGYSFGGAGAISRFYKIGAGGSVGWFNGSTTNITFIGTSGLVANRLGIGPTGNNDADTILARRAAANLQLGAADAAAPVAQTLSVQSVVAGTSNTAGANLTIAGSQGTGTGAGGSIVFQVAPAGTTGTAQNSLATFAEMTSARAFNLYNTTDVTTNFERAKFAWESDILRIGTAKGGTGTARALELQTDGVTRLTIATNGAISTPVAASSTVTIQSSFSTTTSYNFVMWSGAGFGWSGSASIGPSSTPDTVLRRDTANTLAQRNDTNAQTFRVYNTFTSATNFERAKIAWSSNVLQIGTEKGADGGTARALELQTDGTTRLTIAAASGDITTTGSVTTAAPTGGTAAAWKLGTVASVTPTSPDRTIEVDIGGTIYYLHAKTTND